MKKMILVLVIAVVAVFGVSLFLYDMGIDNTEMSLREKFKGQSKVCKTSHDLMFKVITQDAQVTEKYAEDFENIFAKISDNLMGDDAVLKLVAGFNPSLSPDMYKELMSTIKTERAKFKRAQDICIDVSREYATYIKTKPQTWFINNDILDGKDYFDRKFTKDEINDAKLTMETEEAWNILAYKPVTSTNTENVFEKGVDDNVELFSKNENKEVSSVKQSDDTKTPAEKIKDSDILKDKPEAILAIDNAINTK